MSDTCTPIGKIYWNSLCNKYLYCIALRDLDGHGFFKALFTFFRPRPLYKDYKKMFRFKAKNS